MLFVRSWIMLSGTLYYALAVNRIFEAYPTGAIGEGSRA